MAQGKKDDANVLLQCLFATIVPEGQNKEEDDPAIIFQDLQEVISPNVDSQNSQSQIGQTSESHNSQPKCANSLKKGNCRFFKECRNKHPKFFKKFTKHRSLKFSPQGCDRNAACRNLLGTKESNREKSRFYHIKGTNAKKIKRSRKKRKKLSHLLI